MTEKRAIEVLENEIRCVDRRVKGDCNGGSDCQTCGLVLPDTEIKTALANAIKALSGKHGKWVECTNGNAFWFECSVCGKVITELRKFPKFCVRCGAKMDGKNGDQNEKR